MWVASPDPEALSLPALCQHQKQRWGLAEEVMNMRYSLCAWPPTGLGRNGPRTKAELALGGAEEPGWGLV